MCMRTTSLASLPVGEDLHLVRTASCCRRTRRIEAGKVSTCIAARHWQALVAPERPRRAAATCTRTFAPSTSRPICRGSAGSGRQRLLSIGCAALDDIWAVGHPPGPDPTNVHAHHVAGQLQVGEARTWCALSAVPAFARGAAPIDRHAGPAAVGSQNR